MKLPQQLRYLLCLLFGFVLSLNYAVAVEPKLKLTDLVIPQITQENQLATKRTASRLVNSHYQAVELNDEFSHRIFDRYLKALDFNRNTFFNLILII